MKYQIPLCPIDAEHVVVMAWDNEADMKLFLDTFVIPNAKNFGFTVTYTNKEGVQAQANPEPKSLRV